MNHRERDNILNLAGLWFKYKLCLRQQPATSRVHARKASVHGALPAPLLLLQDPWAQTRLHRPLWPLPTLTDTHHSGQELPGGMCQQAADHTDRFTLCLLFCLSFFTYFKLYRVQSRLQFGVLNQNPNYSNYRCTQFWQQVVCDIRDFGGSKHL